jgi:hypothetical protein
MIENYPPEVQALLLCAQPTRTDIEIARIRSLVSGDLDWKFFYKLARRHSLLPLLYHRLQQASSDSIPSDELKKLRLAYEQNVARNLIFANELVQLTKALGDAGIESIAYKGPVLSLLAYGDPALRRFVDLDLMVRRRDVLPAAEVFIKRGYLAAKDLSVDQQALLLRTQHNLQFTREEGRLVVELHWQVSSHLFVSSVTAEDLWKHLERVRLNGSELRTFSIEDLLFSLCVHGTRHLWERLAWVADVAHLLHARPGVDWAALLNRAKTSEAERMFLLGIQLAATLLNAPMPDVVRLRIDDDKQIGFLAAQIIVTLFDGPEHHSATAGQIFKYNIRVRGSWRARLRYMLFTLEPTDSDLGLFQLPRGMGFAYYLVRPFRLFAKRQSRTCLFWS